MPHIPKPLRALCADATIALAHPHAYSSVIGASYQPLGKAHAIKIAERHTYPKEITTVDLWHYLLSMVG